MIGGCRKIYDNHYKVVCAKFAHTTTNNVQKMQVPMCLLHKMTRYT